MTTVDNWPVEISLREEDGQTRAEARLRSRLRQRRPVRRCGEKDRESLRERAATPVRSPTTRCFTGWSSAWPGVNRAVLDVMTERGAAAVAPEPGRDSRPFAGSGMKSDDVGRIMGAQCEHVVALRPRPTGDG